MTIPIVTDGTPSAVLVVGRKTAGFDLWVAGEIQRYVRKLSGAELPIVAFGEPAPTVPARVLVGSPDTHPLIARLQRAGQVDCADLKPDGFILKSLAVDDVPTLIAAGNDERGTMYAAYDLLERLGVVFQFTGDIIPETRRDLALPPLDVRLEPAVRHRGFHVLPFMMPWLGYDDFCRLADQLAKLKCNYLEFHWYEGEPWIEYEYRGEKRLIGDICHRESGYRAWRRETFSFSTDDVVIGREHFSFKRPCAPEFQDCETPEEAHRVARELLTRMIEYAHRRKIEVWLGTGDCPTVPPNLGRFEGKRGSWGMPQIPPGNPAGVEIWTRILESMLDTYPEADGHWLWLAELYLDAGDTASEQVLRQYDGIRHLLPGKEQLRAMGYDQYVRHLEEKYIAQGDLGLLHYGKSVVERVRQSHPGARLGVSLLGRSYLFPALHALLPEDVRLQSMEASPCWNRGSRVPMENFGGLDGREVFLVPRLGDDENEFGLQFNVGLYEHDRVLAGSRAFGVSGIVPQTGRTRGLEHNARYITEGCWNPDLRAAEFYASYAERTFGRAAREALAGAYRLLDENELFIGLRVDAGQSLTDHYFQGMRNFCSYSECFMVQMLAWFNDRRRPQSGADWLNREDVQGTLDKLDYRLRRLGESVVKLGPALDLLENARNDVSPGARAELEYVILKTEAFRLHLRADCAAVRGVLDYAAAYTAKREGRLPAMHQRFQACAGAFAEAYALAAETARRSAAMVDHPGERHTLFRYNVRVLLPLGEFQKFIRNAVNYHAGQPYWEKVDWDIINPA